MLDKFKHLFGPLQILLCLAILAVGIWIWPTKKGGRIQGNGILMPATGRLYGINTRVNGIVKTLNVKPGDMLAEGQLVGSIADSEYEIQLAEAKKKVDQLAEQLAALKMQVATEGQAMTDSLQAQLSSGQFNLVRLNQRIATIEDQLATRQLLLQKGLISTSAVADVQSRLSDAEVQREAVKSAIAGIEYNLTKGYRVEDLQAMTAKLNEATIARDILLLREKYYTVNSPWAGQVLEMDVAEGQIVNRGQVLVLLEVDSNHDSDEVLAYFPIERGKEIKVGDSAQIAFSTVSKKKYGVMPGRVVRVSEYPVSDESLSKRYYNNGLIKYLTDGAAVIEVAIAPEKKRKQISTGTVGKVTVTF